LRTTPLLSLLLLAKSSGLLRCRRAGLGPVCLPSSAGIEAPLLLQEQSPGLWIY
jgi:hypothetical protein